MNGSDEFWMMNRRRLLGLATSAGLASLLPRQALSGTDLAQLDRIESAESERRLVRFPEKTGLILITDRPPQLETPLHYFRQDLTPNEAYFVRWHLSGYPTQVDTRTFRLRLDGQVANPQSFLLMPWSTSSSP